MITFSQIAWNRPNVVGHSMEQGEIDHTEAFGAFDSILNSHCAGVRCIDIGGGKHDFNTAYCAHKYLIQLSVLDPFMRTKEHNEKVLETAKNRPFDFCTSISVLNVINLKESRIEHLKLCRSVVKECGKVFFKVWPGDESGIEKVIANGFQSI